jgi:hypothetical protein
VNTKLRRKKIKSNNWENNNILNLQQSQLIPVVVNKYALLDSLQEEPETSQILNRTSKVALLRNKIKCPPNKKKWKISIGENHTRSYTAEI